MAKIVCCDMYSKEGSPNHTGFMNAIKKHDGCCQITRSCWVIATAESTKQIRDQLSPFLTTDERLFVANLDQGSGAWVNIIESSDILQNILKY
jgi:hypothetical protein